MTSRVTMQQLISVAAVLACSACSDAEHAPGGGAGSGSAKACSELYDPDQLESFDVEIDPVEWDGMNRDCRDNVKAYRPIVLHHGSESVPAMMRLKGNWSWNCDKMQFLISFNEQDPQGRFHGLRKLVLDAPWYDPTLLHERVAFEYHRTRGSLYSCVNHARLSINGEYYGLYANVERIDREYLERHFEDPSGNLFKEGRELTTNEDAGDTGTVDAFWATADVTELEGLVDIEQALDVWSGSAMLPDPDSYWAGVEINFYLYEHPSRGLLFLPYDSDIAFGEQIWPDAERFDPIRHEHVDWGREPQYRAILEDPAWCAKYEAALRRARDAYEPTALTRAIDRWAAQIRPALEEDPNRTFSVEEHDAALEAMRTFPQRRAAFVDDWLSEPSHCPPSWNATPPFQPDRSFGP